MFRMVWGMPLELMPAMQHMNPPDCHQHVQDGLGHASGTDATHAAHEPARLSSARPEWSGHASGTDAHQTVISTFRMVWGVPLELMPAMQHMNPPDLHQHVQDGLGRASGIDAPPDLHQHDLNSLGMPLELMPTKQSSARSGWSRACLWS